jgi:ATP-binding cassette, subfamily B, multidrug efflux pump
LQAQAVNPPPGRRRGERSAAPSSLPRAIRYLRNQRRAVIFAYGALVLATLAQLAVPQIVQRMIDTIARASTVTRSEGENLLIGAVALIIVFALIRGLFSFVQSFMAETTSHGVAFDLRNEIFAKIQRLSFSYYDQHQTGQLMIRATDDVERVRIFVAQGLVLMAQAFLLLVSTLFILFLTNWRLTLAIIPVLPVTIVFFMYFGRISQPLFMELQKRLSVLNTILQENVAGIKVVKAFTRESHEQQRFGKAADHLYEQGLKVGRTFSVLFPIIFSIGQIGQAIVLYVGGRQAIGGTLTTGEYQEFSLYLAYMILPVANLGFIITLMAQAATSSQRIFEILDAESDVKDKPNALTLPSIEGRVEFKNVTFRYTPSGDPVLKNVSFTAQPGQTIALLGATGSGKTTIINLLPRFYDVSEGVVLIDWQDVRDVTIDSLRSQIGIVLQETNLFSGTIRDNIAFGRPDATMDAVIAAAQAAAAHDFIMAFPDGYETAVGERGVTLSGGQKQRIAIARALILDPKLLILDDSTSSVDLMTEYRIQQALDNLMQGRTSFVIAQRISTVLNADQILVLEKGQIVASGTHEELMEDSPIYAEIYNSQLVGDADASADGNETAASTEQAFTEAERPA